MQKVIKSMKSMKKAFGYLRTSSATNVGEDKDSDKRQRLAIADWASRNGFEVDNGSWFYDAAVSGADPIDARPGFTALLAALDNPPGMGGYTTPAAGDGHSSAPPEKKFILVESPDRFARDLIVQMTGHDMLKAKGIELIPVSTPGFFREETPTAVFIRNVLGAVYQLERASLVAKLAGARARKKAATGKCGGRKSHAELRPEVVALAKQLRRKKPKGGQMSYAAIARELADLGHFSSAGTMFTPMAVSRMIEA